MSTLVTVERPRFFRMGDQKAEKVLKALAERDLSIAWAARQIGESRQVVHNWLKGVKNPSDPTVFDRLLAAVEGSVLREPRAVYGEPNVMVPLSAIGAAGSWSASEAHGAVSLPLQLASDDYRAVLVEGNSMLPNLLPGDVAVFREWTVPKIGFVNACTRDGHLMLKLVAVKDGAMVLRSFNPSEPDIPADGCLCIGFLVGLYRDDGVETMHRHNRGGLRFD